MVTDVDFSNGDSNGAAAGWVSIVPTEPAPPGGSPCLLDPATGFEVQGFFAGGA